MQPRGLAKNLIMTQLAPYVPAEWNGKNESGIRAIGDRVLVLPDKAAAQSAGTHGAPILFTDQKQDIDGLAAETGVIISIGDGAWTWNSDRTRPYKGTKPVVGQRVWFDRYAGSPQHGKDGVVYKIMDDKCIGAIADE